ncbi:hypothetical protein PPTG_19918 [Phytophthora nicotianae INRA-310]|uniref:Uncharacterized protein n=1 Tax=Phytophthora nicotianae (strain INRA-310) TaxID=761204 RepID=W2PCH9_PHYN3|nr:hypothetical protein PPTG_19918 [Phytophthora nicotianae INRA-310]ETM97918.1 hypothetical protein PPTG_19918 [Phytophthora nicotianae INRA-310]
MVDEPPLLLVKLALPPKLQGLHHVLQVISGFVIPNTIDGAVYNNLQRIIRAGSISTEAKAARQQLSSEQPPMAITTRSNGYISIIHRSAIPIENLLLQLDTIKVE